MEEFDFTKDVDLDVAVDLDFDTDVQLDKDVNINVDVTSDLDLDGNVAIATFAVEAIGSDTLAEADINVLVIEGQLSSIDGVLIAAAG